MIGAHGATVNGNVHQGAAYVFTRSGVNWSQQAKLTAADGAATDDFGFAVSLSGTTAIVGALSDDVGTNENQGSAYVFVRSPFAAIWSQQAKLTFSEGAGQGDFGQAVSIAGNTAVVGLPDDDIGTVEGVGSACVFTRAGTTWTQQARLTASDGAVDDFSGDRSRYRAIRLSSALSTTTQEPPSIKGPHTSSFVPGQVGASRQNSSPLMVLEAMSSGLMSPSPERQR